MDHFEYRDGELWCEAVPADEIAAAYGTPCYVYSASTLRGHFARLTQAFAPLAPTVCFSVKSCPNLEIQRLLVALGCGLDCVSGGELERAWLAGCPMDRVVFAGVGKSEAELRAAMDGRFSPLGDSSAAGRGPVGLLNIESQPELDLAGRLADELGVTITAALRINPDIDPATHRYIATGKQENKFGVDLASARRLLLHRPEHPRLRLRGLHVHLGSQITSPGPFVQATERLLTVIDEMQAAGRPVEVVDLGGGFGAAYETGSAPAFASYAERLTERLAHLRARGVRFVIEPGRSIAANAGVLLTRVRYVKQGSQRRFVICDAGMHTLLRPSLYGAFHFIWPTQVAPGHTPPRRAADLDLPGLAPADVVGPLCETGDFLAEGRSLPPVDAGALLAVFTAGAYGMSMASNYNSHPLPAEVLVDGAGHRRIRRAQSLAEMLAQELGL
jgi:diaminopimelate decarboxylase